MIRIVAITFGFVVSVLMLALVHWFEVEELNVQKINREHLDAIQRLKKISKINAWLDRVVKPSIEALPTNEKLSDDSLVKFYDTYSKDFNFKISKYIYNDENSHNLDIQFKIDRDREEYLEKLMKLKYSNGFLKFNFFELKTESVSGKLQLVQPFYGENNASYH